jgi:hypothetical protein
VHWENGQRIIDFFSKDAAELFAEDLARMDKPCEVRVHGVDGKVERTLAVEG